MPHNERALDSQALLRESAFLRRLARGLLPDEHSVEDVVQQAYVSALEHRPERLRAWLRRVVRHLVFRSHRTSSRRERRERAAARSEVVPGVVDVVSRLEIQRRVVEAVLALEEPYRSVIVGRYFDELPPGEIARRHGVPLETVRTQLQRARDQLRARLDRVYNGRRHEWSASLVALVLPTLDRPTLAAATGGTLMTMQAKIALVTLPLCGVVVGALGHAAFQEQSGERVRAPTERPDRYEVAEHLPPEKRKLESEATHVAEEAQEEKEPGPPRAAKPVPAKPDPKDILNQKRVFDGAIEGSLGEVLSLIRAATDLDIVVDPAVPSQAVIELVAQQITVRQALDLILQPNELAWEARYGVIFVSTAKRMATLPEKSPFPDPAPHKVIDLEFLNTPLSEALQALQRKLGVEFRPSLGAEQAVRAVRVSVQAHGLDAPNAMALTLLPVGFVAEVTPGQVFVRPAEK